MDRYAGGLLALILLALGAVILLRRVMARLDALEDRVREDHVALRELRIELARLGGPEAAPDLPRTDADDGSGEADSTQGERSEQPSDEARQQEPHPALSRVPAARQSERASSPRPAPRAEGAGPARPTGEAHDVERALASRWLVWLGGLAVALSAVFLFSYAVEQGWLGPATRVGLGLALGGALIAGGEWVHRRPLARLADAAGADYVPQALTASGVFALYASIYAAHALYALIAPVPAFAGLAMVSAGGLALALRQGWFVALLGLAGGYAVPALLHSTSHTPLPVFIYLAALTAGCLALTRLRRWPFVAIATLVGSAGWPLIWIVVQWHSGDEAVLGPYSLAVAALCALFSTSFPTLRKAPAPVPGWSIGIVTEATAGLGFLLHGLMLVLLALVVNYSAVAFVFLGLYAALGLFFGLRHGRHEGLAVLSAAVVALAFLLWPEQGPLTVPPELARHGIEHWGDTFGPIAMPQEFRIFALAALAFAALFGLGGFAALRRAATPALWAGLSAAMPIYLLAVAYWRIGGLGLDLRWGALAAALAAAMLAAAAATARLERDRGAAPLGIYAAATTAALALAFTCVLREAWLTVALSAEVLALAWIWSRLRLAELRAVAWLAAATVVVRLVLNPAVIAYEGGVGDLMSWVAYGYGLPAIAFLLAARLFGDARTEPLAALCEAAAAAFGFLAVSLQLKAWTSGSLFTPNYALFDQAVQTAWWLTCAGLLLRREVTARSHVARYGSRALLVLAGAQVVLGHLVLANPLLSAGSVGTLPVLNLLGLAYLVPALLAWVLAAGRRLDLPDEMRPALGGAAGMLIFVYLTLETRHVFQGDVIALSRAVGEAEIYAYSAVWLLYALGLLALGVLGRSAMLRYASLSVLIVTILKAFLYDMADLDGLYRVASFLGLGLALIGIGYVYRRLVFRPRPEAR